MPGIERITFDPAHDRFILTVGPDGPSDEAILETVKRTGFGARILKGDPTEGAPEAASRPEGPLPALIAEGLERAVREGRLLLVEFHASWCVACKRMEEETYRDPRVKGVLERYVFLPVDVDAHPDVAKRFGVRVIPDARILDGEGKELGRITGYEEPAEVAALLEQLAASGSR